MKKAFIISIIAGLSMLSVGCGTVESSSSSSRNEKASVAEETSEATTAAGEETTTVAETTVEPTTADLQVSDTDPAETTAANDTAAPSYDDSYGYKFTLPEGSFSFPELFYHGFANITPEDKAYCLIQKDGAAGHSYYELYVRSDDGETWNDCGVYDEASGEKYRFSLEDGRILVFSYHTAYCEAYPTTFVYELNGDKLVRTDCKDIFADIKLDDGSSLKNDGNYDFKAEYNAGYSFSFTITDKDTGASYSAVNELDPETFAIVK
ncbi:MAG: hypothetical protein GXY08_01320 [Ruminococcus sp.]|nr:hypothetical protein [Ruminococcus sp.]